MVKFVTGYSKKIEIVFKRPFPVLRPPRTIMLDGGRENTHFHNLPWFVSPTFIQRKLIESHFVLPFVVS